MAIRKIQRVSEEYIYDPATSLYYWLAPVYKKGTDQQLLDDMNAMVKRLGEIKQKGEHVFRPTAMIQKSAMGKIGRAVISDTLSKNTYLMLFDFLAEKPAVIPDGTAAKEWVSGGNNIFLWSKDDTVYTWCDSNAIAHRFPRATKEEALTEQFIQPKPPADIDEQLEDLCGYIPTTYHITGKLGLLGDIDITVEAE